MEVAYDDPIACFGEAGRSFDQCFGARVAVLIECQPRGHCRVGERRQFGGECPNLVALVACPGESPYAVLERAEGIYEVPEVSIANPLIELDDGLRNVIGGPLNALDPRVCGASF